MFMHSTNLHKCVEIYFNTQQHMLRQSRLTLQINDKCGKNLNRWENPSVLVQGPKKGSIARTI